MALTYVCSPLSAPTRAEMLANAAKASTYMMKAEQEFGNRAVAPHAYLPFLLDDAAPEERALALVVLICTRKGVNDTADQQRHERRDHESGGTGYPGSAATWSCARGGP